MSSKLSDAKIDELWQAYLEKQSVLSVATKCEVSQQTVRRYRDLLGWDERVKKVRHKAQDKADDAEAERRARHIGLGLTLQKQGLDAFRRKRAKVKAKTAHDARQCIVDGIRIEREAVGEAGEITAQKITVEYVTGNGELSDEKAEN